MSSATEPIGDRILGVWQLIKFVYRDHLNREEKYFGQDPEGILIYEKTGFMSVQIAQEGRPNFEKDSIDGGSEADKAKAFSTFFSYYGRFKEPSPGKFVHTIEGSLFPNWIGQEQVRFARFQSNILYLTTPPISSMGGSYVFEISWKRVTN